MAPKKGIDGDKKRTTFYIDPEIHQQMKLISVQENKSLSEMVEKFFKAEIKKREKKNK